jgi:site-specific recombinase XerD
MKHLKTLAAEFVLSQEGRGLAKGTLERTRSYLKRFSLWLAGRDIRDLTSVSLVDYTGFLRRLTTGRNSPLSLSSIEVELSVLKGFFEYLYKNEYLLTNPMDGVPLSLTKNKTERKIFSEEDISVFLDSIPVDSAAGQRDRAMFELMYSSGFRVGEIARLTIGCLNTEERICFIKQSKGKKDRYVPFSNAALAFIVKYLGAGRKKHEKRVRKSEMKEYVFLGKNGRMSWKTIWTRFLFYCKECGLEKEGYTPHSIRHATGTHLLAHGASIRYVQELLGHSSLKTTQIYTRPCVDNVKKMYKTYHPRENDFYVELDGEYIREVAKLKEELLQAKEFERNRRNKKTLQG